MPAGKREQEANLLLRWLSHICEQRLDGEALTSALVFTTWDLLQLGQEVLSNTFKTLLKVLQMLGHCAKHKAHLCRIGQLLLV